MIQNKTMTIGLTGGISSGKSTVAQMIKEQGIPIIDSDQIARKVVEKDSPLLKKLAEYFGEEVLLSTGELNREYLGNLVFQNEEQRKTLDQMMHPVIFEEMKEQLQNLKQQGEPLIFLDIPLLFETEIHLGEKDIFLDEIWLVYVPRNLQVERLMSRDNISKSYALEKIRSQLSLEKKKDLADIVIENDDGLDDLHEKVELEVNRLWEKSETSMNRGIKKLILLLSCMGVLLTGCNLSTSIEIKEITQDELIDLNPVSGGELILPLTNMEGRNPLLTENEDYYQLMKLVYDSLFVTSAGGKLVPSVAEHYEFSEDGYTLSVTIKDGIKWQDGEPLTAQDVVTTFNALRNLPSSSAYYQLMRHSIGVCNPFSPEGFARAVVFDERNIDFQFDKPYKNALQMMTFPILPSHLLTEDEMIEEENFQIVGTGPFKYQEEENLQEIVLVKNTNYYGREPYLDKVRGTILSSKESVDTVFETAQVDMARAENFDWDKYQSNSRIRFEEFFTNEVDFLAFNLRREKFQGDSGKYIRQAIARGVNKKRIVESLYLGKADVATFFLHPEMAPGNALENKIYYNMEESRELLKKAGYEDRNEDGLVEDLDGNTLRIGVSTNSFNYLRKTTADLIVDDLKSMGIDAYSSYPPVEVDAVYDKKSIQSQWTNYYEALRQGDFELALVGINFSNLPDIGTVLYSGAIGNTNIAAYSNQEIDIGISRLSLQGVDHDEKTIYNKINDQFIEDCPYVPLYFKRGALLKDQKLQGKVSPTEYDLYRDVKDLYIPKELRS